MGGVAAQDLAAKLELDDTLRGAEKIFAITKALVETAIEKGKADADILFSVLLDVAQARLCRPPRRPDMVS